VIEDDRVCSGKLFALLILGQGNLVMGILEDQVACLFMTVNYSTPTGLSPEAPYQNQEPCLGGTSKKKFQGLAFGRARMRRRCPIVLVRLPIRYQEPQVLVASSR
jgi:hypothetical protein